MAVQPSNHLDTTKYRAEDWRSLCRRRKSMGKKDDTMYDYLEKPDRFADLANVVLFQGSR